MADNSISRKFGGTTVVLTRGDITRQAVDAIVNAANSGLHGGGGVDGAIHRAGGPTIMQECDQIRSLQGGCPPGQAVITGGGKLPCKYVIHTVGPRWRDGTTNEDETLSNAYKNSLKLAQQYEVKTIAFPSISTGAYAFPVDRAANIALNTVRDFCSGSEAIEEVRFALFDEYAWQAFQKALSAMD